MISFATMQWISISPKIKIHSSEISYKFSRSSGPGGQHVNKSNTRVTLIWNLETSRLPLQTKDLMIPKLSHRLLENGEIHVSSDRFRSQERNKEDCLEKFIKLLKSACHRPQARRATKTPKAQKQKRLDDKKKRSLTKEMRKKVY